VAASQAPSSAADSPLGPGPITFGTSVGADFGALSLQRSPDGSLSTTEDLSTLTYAATKDLVLHVTCSPACTGSRISVEVTALQSSTETGGWPYPSVGLIRCVLPAAPTVTIPSQAVAAMLATDTRFDTIVTRVARLATTATTERDVDGNPIVVETGRGVFGRAPH
jgi:hypothetical protein